MRIMAKKPRRQKLRFIDPLLVSVPEFARMSGLGQSLIRQLVDDGTLPHRMIGTRAWIIRQPAVAWLCEQVEPRPAA
jgi:hypothetical protein